MQIEQPTLPEVPQNLKHLEPIERNTSLSNKFDIFNANEATIKSTSIQTFHEEKPKKKNTLRISQSLDRAVCDNQGVNGAYQPLIIGPTSNANEFWPEHEIKNFDTQNLGTIYKRESTYSLKVMADEETIDIDTDSLEISLLQTSCEPIDSKTTTLDSLSSVSEKSTMKSGSELPDDSSDSLQPFSIQPPVRPLLVRQSMSKNCESPETSSPDFSSNPSSGSIPKRQRTYSSSSSTSSKSSPSTAITWSALGCSSNPSHNISAHTSAAAAAAKAASNTGRRPYISTKPKSPRVSTQVTNRRLGFPIQRALTLPTSTEESQGLLDVSYGDDTSNYNLNTGNMKNICMMMKSPMHVAPPSVPSITDCEEKDDYITIEIGDEEVKSDASNKDSSEKTLKCDDDVHSNNISSSSTSETLIDIQCPSVKTTLGSPNRLGNDDNSLVEENSNYQFNVPSSETVDLSFPSDSTIQAVIPSIDSKQSNNHTKYVTTSRLETTSESSPTAEDKISDKGIPKSRDGSAHGPFENYKTTSAGNKLLRSQTVSCSREPSPNRNSQPPSLSYIIPTFTVTINPLEANEVTLPLPESPKQLEFPNTSLNKKETLDNESSNRNRSRNNSAKSKRSIANTTIIVDEEGNEVIQEDNVDISNGRMLSVDSDGGDDEELRRCSIGSASSLQDNSRGNNGNNLCAGYDAAVDRMDTLGLGDLGIRRVSDISHINEIRRELPGMDHLASEFYEISREPNPDAISLDSIHKRVLKRCQNKYIPAQRSSTANKCFVVITTGFTVLGIIYGFWYKNFGPGKLDEYKNV